MQDDATTQFKPREEETPQDWGRLAAFLETRGHDLCAKPSPRQFAGGFGNLNFLLEMDGRSVVLRRPPLGPIPPGANDMRRENRILRVLWQAFSLAPRSLVFCDDDSVLGAPFFIMEYRPGLVIRGDLPAGVPDNAGETLGPLMMRRLSELHAVDTDAIGLGDFGRPEGFVARTVGGWLQRAALAWEAPPPLLDELGRWLDAHRPRYDRSPALLHNDYKLDNIVLDPQTLDSVAVLDWDMGTRGDPLVDLGATLAYWTEVGDPWAMRAINQMPTAGHGFPTRRAAVELYAHYSGRDVSDILFYRVFGQFRIAVVFMQLNRRYREGGTRDPRFAEFGRMADGLLDFAHEVAQGRAF